MPNEYLKSLKSLKSYTIRGLCGNQWRSGFLRARSITDAVALFVVQYSEVSELSIKKTEAHNEANI